MLKNIISIEELQNAVVSYEERVLMSSFVTFIDGNNNLMKFKGRRRDKIAVVSLHKFPNVHLPQLLKQVAATIDATPTISDIVEFFTVCRITSEVKESLVTMALRDFALSLTVFDGNIMDQQEEFKDLWEDTQEEQPLDETEKSLYDYLSVSNDSSDIKNGIYLSLMLLIIYRHGSISEANLKEEMRVRFGREVGDIGKDIKQLREAGKLKPRKIELTQDEIDKVRAAENEAKAVEDDFMRRYDDITSQYGIGNKETVLEALRQIYIVSSKYDYSDNDAISGRMPDDIKKAYDHLDKTLHSSLDGIVAIKAMSALMELCSETSYMQRIGINTAFLNLYRSSRYEDYLNSQICNVVLDTPVLINFICGKSGLNIQDDWNDPNYSMVKDLTGYKESQQGKVRFLVPYDYLVETFYEYKKALQLTWFSQFNLPIPPETTNVFYNYYLFIRQQKEAYGELGGKYTFEDFAKEMGFPVSNTALPTLKRQCLSTLRRVIELYHCDYIDEITETYANFDKVRDTYASTLEEKGRDKTTYAIIADVRQAFYITNEKRKPENAHTEYYFCTLDRTLVPLRNAVAQEALLRRTYAIQTPQSLLNKLSFKFFHLAKGSVSDTVFTYAEKEYSVATKIRSLYDNVLIPYFASANKGNVRLVVAILNMEKARWDKESQETSKTERRTALEDIFLDVIHMLPKRQLTTQNLRDLLANQDMNDQVTSLFQQAFDARRDNKIFNLAEPMCELMKEIVVKNDGGEEK